MAASQLPARPSLMLIPPLFYSDAIRQIMAGVSPAAPR